MTQRRQFGLAVVGCGAIGGIRTRFARAYPGVGWIGLCDKDEARARRLGEEVRADFVTTDYEVLIARREVDAVIVATNENYHVGPTMAAVRHGRKLFIEKPLATDAEESAEVLAAIEAAGIDAVIGYTQRFRRRFLVVKEKLTTGQIGDVTGVVARAFMNRMAPTAALFHTNDRTRLTPMVVSGTHSLDMCMWLMGGKTPVEVDARSNDRMLGPYGTKDSTFGLFTMDDGTLFSMNMSWALPTHWPGAVYGLEIGIVGTDGVIDIEDTHRDVILATAKPQGAAYNPDGWAPESTRHVDFLTSFPPGDIHMGQLWGPMREETNAWFGRLYTGMATPHATPQDGHRNLVLTKAMDLSARRGAPVKLPVDLAELGQG
ncbi:MAG: Gfo/Idh/MocA family protein [Alphaproteobacteria bacterium]